MSIFKPILTVASLVSSIPIVNGQLVAACDTGELYIDQDGIRTKYCDVDARTYSEIALLQNPFEDKIYFATDTHQLLQATRDNNTVVWHQLGGSQSEVVTNSNAAVSIELADNKIYYLTNNNLTSITLTVAASLSYCTICFTAGTSTSWTVPNNARCIGYDCTGGIFTPVAGREYQIAVDKLDNLLTFYVINTRLDSGSDDSASQVIVNTDSSVSLIVDNNTIYRCTNSALSSLTISGVTSQFKYATIIFTSPSSDATQFGMPDNGTYYCKGAACEDGEFNPDAGMRYNLALENEGDRIAIYVMEAL